MGLLSQSDLVAIKTSLQEREPLVCGCEHEARFGEEILQLGMTFNQAVQNAFCSKKLRRNPMCAHSSLRQVLSDPYLSEITVLIRLGVLDASWMERSRQISQQIFSIDSKAGIQGRARCLNADEIRVQQQPVVEALRLLRRDILAVLDAYLP